MKFTDRSESSFFNIIQNYIAVHDIGSIVTLKQSTFKLFTSYFRRDIESF